MKPSRAELQFLELYFPGGIRTVIWMLAANTIRQVVSTRPTKQELQALIERLGELHTFRVQVGYTDNRLLQSQIDRLCFLKKGYPDAPR